MAITLRAFDAASGTVYAILRNAAGNYFDPADSTFKAFVSAATHKIAMTALANQAQVYEASVTTTNFGATAAKFDWVAYRQLGGSPALSTDLVLGSEQVMWDGDEEADIAQVQEILEDGTVPVDVTKISGDSAAADNLEAMFDNTGYNASNSTVGNVTLVATTTSVTNIVTANVTQISGDSTAADLLEAVFDACHSGTAQAGAAGTITLAAGASAVTDFYKDSLVMLYGGTGTLQGRLITAYNGTTKVATISPNWGTNPDVTATYIVIPKGRVEVVATSIAAAVWGALRADYKTAGAFGEQPSPNYTIRAYSYNSNGEPLGFTVRFYDTSTNAALDDGSTGFLYGFTTSALTWSGGNPLAVTVNKRD